MVEVVWMQHGGKGGGKDEAYRKGGGEIMFVCVRVCVYARKKDER